jgi:DNA-binding winged helix-turn-helix (wHTH) protein/tetratricopeptide (TPR) repeat protein
MTPTDGQMIYEFGDFRLDAGLRLLTLKADGRNMPLVSRAFDTLLYLVQHPGELIAKDVLINAVWPATVVEDNNLSQSIAAIRRVLGERPGDHKYIVTIPGRGFKFVAAVTMAGVLGKDTTGDNPAPVPMPAGSPAADQSGAGKRSSHVWQRAAMFAAAAVVLITIAYFVRESHRKPPQLSARAIHLTEQADRQLQRRYTDDDEAYQLYVNGLFQRSRGGEEGFRQAIAFFEQAIARDENYALAYVGLADCYAILGVFGAAAPDEVFPRALAAVNRALEIDSKLGEAHASLGHIKLQYERDLPGAEREYQRALELASGYAMAHMWYGLYLAWTGRIDDGIASLREAQKLQPLQLTSSANIGMLLYNARRYDEAIQQLRSVVDAAPDMDHARSFLGRAYLRTGDTAAAIREFKLRKSLSVGSYADLGMALALAGRREEAVAELNRVLALRSERYVSAYDIASIQASLGDADQAFEWLDRAVAEHAGMLRLLGGDQSFDGLRHDERMTALLARINAPRATGSHAD